MGATKEDLSIDEAFTRSMIRYQASQQAMQRIFEDAIFAILDHPALGNGCTFDVDRHEKAARRLRIFIDAIDRVGTEGEN